MVNYHKIGLINKCLKRYYNTFALTLDTVEFVPEEFNNKILSYIYKELKKTLRNIDRDDKKYQFALRSKQKAKARLSKIKAKDK